MGGEVGFDTASSSFIKYSAGVALNKSDFSAALLMYVYMKLNVCFRSCFSMFLYFICFAFFCLQTVTC